MVLLQFTLSVIFHILNFRFLNTLPFALLNNSLHGCQLEVFYTGSWYHLRPGLIQDWAQHKRKAHQRCACRFWVFLALPSGMCIMPKQNKLFLVCFLPFQVFYSALEDLYQACGKADLIKDNLFFPVLDSFILNTDNYENNICIISNILFVVKSSKEL